jgi:hypothetical protein
MVVTSELPTWYSIKCKKKELLPMAEVLFFEEGGMLEHKLRILEHKLHKLHK